MVDAGSKSPDFKKRGCIIYFALNIYIHINIYVTINISFKHVKTVEVKQNIHLNVHL
jgi:hypothetical protein